MNQINKFRKEITKKKKALAFIICLFIILTYFLFNFENLSMFIDSDIHAYTQNVEQGRLVNMFNPHHLLFDYSGFLFYKATENIGNLSADALFNQRIKSLLVASLGAGLIFLFLFFLSGRIFLSLIFTGFIVFARGYISYAGLNDTPLIHTVLCILLFFTLYYYNKVKYKFLFVILLAVFHSVTVFFHQANALFYPVIIFFILNCYKNVSLKKRLIHSIAYTFFLIFIVGGMYFYVGLFIIKTSLFGGENLAYFGIKGTGNFFNWLSFYAHQGVWGAGHEGQSLNKILYGISGAVVRGISFIRYKENYFDLTNFFQEKYAALNVMFVFMVSFTVLYILLIKKLYKKYGPVILALALWFVIYLTFFSWWEPEYFEFWLITVSTFFIMIFFVFDYLLDLVKEKFIIKISVNTIAYTLIFLCFIILAGHNYYYVVYPRSKNVKFGWIGKYKERIMKRNFRMMYK